ncbi:MAG: hypothetical protein ABL940_06680 [Bacteroidia bacterium]
MLFITIKKYTTTLALILLVSTVFAQKTKPTDKDGDNTDVEQRMEQITEQTENENMDFNTLLDNMKFYAQHPINLNNTNYQELQDFGLLTDIQINNLLKHITANGKLIIIQELQTIDGYDLQTIRKILPYVYVDNNLNNNHATLKQLLTKGDHVLFVRTQTAVPLEKGFTPATDSQLQASPNSRYLGDRFKHYARYRYTYGNNFSVGITGEKDAGEQFFKGTQKQGFDFYSAHIAIRNFGKLKSLVLGDYQAQFGQGLTFSSGLAFGKTADVLAVKRNYLGARPYTSVNENIFMRGAVINVEIVKNIQATAFVSTKKIDASTNNTDTTILNVEDIQASALQISGFHRTPNELNGRGAIRENIVGGNINYQQRTTKIGVTAALVNYSNEIVKTNKIYNQFEAQGKNLATMGVEYSHIFRNINLFGETSRSGNGGLATINGAIIALDPRVNASIIYRNYGRNYQAPFSNAFRENTKVGNEKGLYFGLNVKPINTLALSVYYDRIEYPWLRYQISAPSSGYDFFSQANFTPNKKTSMYLRYRNRSSEKNSSIANDDIDIVTNVNQSNYRFEISYTVSPSLKMKNRVEAVTYKSGAGEKNEIGYLAFHDITYKQLSSPFSGSFRYAIFDAPSYYVRMYSFETNVLYAYSIPSLYGRGVRTYATVRYAVNRKIDIWLRAAATIYNDRTVVGSGLSETQGNSKTDLTLQVRFRL